MSVRLACLFVPLFPLAARLRSEPDLKGEAVAVFEGNGNAARVVAASRKARRAGIEIGMTLPQTRAIRPKLVARARDLEAERAAQEALLEVAESFSPRVEDGGEGVVYLDLEGLPSLRTAEPSVHRSIGPSVHVPTTSDGSTKSPDPERPPPARAKEGGIEEEGTSRDGLPQGPPLRTEEIENPRSKGSRLVETASARASSEQIPPGHSSVVGAGLVPARTLDSSCLLEQNLGQDLIAAAEKAGLPARAGIAASKLSARVAAGLPDSPTVVACGEEASFLAPLPLPRLAPQLEIAETLERWGLRTIGDLAGLPEGEVASRLGELGRALHATARGLDPRPLEPRLPAHCFSEGMDLEWPLVALEPFLFVGHAALERLIRRLESQALACTRLEITLKLDPDGCDARAIQLPAPTRDVKTLLTLVRLELEARPPGAAIAGFAFAAHPDRARQAQLALFGPPALSPDRLATTIARLASMLGADRVGSPRAVDGHRPERFALAAFDPPASPAFLSPPKTGRGLLAVRVLRPPVELEVIVAESVDRAIRRSDDLPAKPASSRPLSLKTRAPDAVPQIAGAVRVAAGPWSMEEGWWSEAPADRDYWDIELSDGSLCRIYRDRKSNQWFADGMYD